MRGYIAIALAFFMAMTPLYSAHAADARTGKWIEANGVMLRYEMTGSGDDVVVLIHDMGMNLEIWDEVMPQIQPGHRILRYDIRGFGLSEKFREPISVDDWLEDLRALLDKLGVNQKVTVVGESIGGTLALKFAARYPDRVKAVVGINALVKIHRVAPPANPALAAGRDTAKLFETEGVRAYLKTDMEWLYPKRLQTPERLNRFMGIEVSQDPQVRALAMRLKGPPANADIDTDLPAIKVPTLIVAGMINSSYTADDMKTITAAIPQGRLVMVESAHHAVFESPELVGPVLKSFLYERR